MIASSAQKPHLSTRTQAASPAGLPPTLMRWWPSAYPVGRHASKHLTTATTHGEPGGHSDDGISRIKEHVLPAKPFIASTNQLTQDAPEDKRLRRRHAAGNSALEESVVEAAHPLDGRGSTGHPRVNRPPDDSHRVRDAAEKSGGHPVRGSSLLSPRISQTRVSQGWTPSRN